jgi:RNA polymerase sigma-70 factor (ECF subfamily)
VPESDADLVARALQGSQDAYRVIADRYAGPVFNLIVRLVRDEGVADELTQDTFVKVFNGLSGFDSGLKLSPWIFRIAHNTAIDYLRRFRPVSVSLDDDTDGIGSAPVVVDERERSPFEQAELADLRQALDWALSQLRPEYRRLVVMRYQEDQSYEDIAAALGMPLGTVKSHLHRARQAMAGLLRAAGWEPAAADRAPE